MEEVKTADSSALPMSASGQEETFPVLSRTSASGVNRTLFEAYTRDVGVLPLSVAEKPTGEWLE